VVGADLGREQGRKCASAQHWGGMARSWPTTARPIQLRQIVSRSGLGSRGTKHSPGGGRKCAASRHLVDPSEANPYTFSHRWPIDVVVAKSHRT
jgi:hypothetical protein